ncbi:dihydrofolate reductase family protein [Flavobacterium silvaticum]|uniref:Dihydrofolate reductase n=1 Tax=Flavobacterium silvaticum TaxID=1852020 RepID=A0A972FVS5_9FLAO|nr:dihydrofolate reductase family protein [Flavobacterium silvaticum]NMH29618.1 dihydrofolate reductase [Flavobacterium silvaticum]
MRKIIVLSMISLDGVLQAPGGPKEDESNGFQYGGWTAPFGDEEFNKAMMEELKPADYLLGRKTFEIWENYWPEHSDFWPGINEGNKYVFSSTRKTSDWKNSNFIDAVSSIEKLKTEPGRDIQVWGSSELIHLLLEHKLVDEIRLKIYPIILGKGKKLFDDNSNPSAFDLTQSTVTTKGVILANYKRAGNINTGDVTV